MPTVSPPSPTAVVPDGTDVSDGTMWRLSRLGVGQGPRLAELAVVGLAVGGLAAVLATVGLHRPEPFLPLAAAVLCMLAAVAHRWIRVPAQAVTVAAVAVALLVAGRPIVDVALPLVLLASVTGLANVLAADLVAARRTEAADRAEAVLRGDLLQAVRDLPNTDLVLSARAASRTLRALGFDGSGVAIIRYGDDFELFLDGIPDPPGGQRRDQGVAGRAMRENRTVVAADYQADSDRLPWRRDFGSAVVVPIRVDGVPVGVLMGARHVASAPTPVEVEVAEVVAAHLEAVIDTDARLRRQREVLDRRRRLDDMRSAFVTQVSDELRHPLTVVRGIGETLRSRDVGASHRDELLRRLGAQTERLSATIDALLDASGVYASRLEPRPRAIAASTLLAPVAERTGVALADAPSTLVDIDVDLVGHGLELLLSSGEGKAGGTTLRCRGTNDGVVLELVHPAGWSRPGVTRTLAVQLLLLGGAVVARDGDLITLPAATEVGVEVAGGTT